MRKSIARHALLLLGMLLFATLVRAHVMYVATPDEVAQNKGADNAFLLAPLHNPVYLGMIIGTAILAIVLVYFGRRMHFVKHIVVRLSERASTYEDLIPWMIRLSLGIGLIGAGVGQALLTPAFHATPLIAKVEIFLGFLLLAGFLIAPALLAVIFLYGLALVASSYAIGNLDIFMMCLALLVQGSAMPGVDDLLNINLFPRLFALQEYVPLLLRIGIGGAMTYLAIYEKFLNPKISALVVQNYHLTSVIPVSAQMWVLAAGIIELLVGLCLLFGFMTRLVVVVAFLVLSCSFFYFGEGVYSHISLFGTLSVLFVTGAGSASIDHWWKKRSVKTAA